jgi:hypothetical protein
VAEQNRLEASDIRSLPDGYGACFATDRITVDGERVGYMYRKEPDNDHDSGWRFTAGTESEAYMDDPAHSSITHVSTVASIDPDIVPFVDAPVGTILVRWPTGSPLGPEPDAPALVLHERQGLTREWSMEVPVGFHRRVVDGSLQMVNPLLPVRTIWINVWGFEGAQAEAELLAELRAEPLRPNSVRHDEPGASEGESRFANWYREEVDGRVQWALYAYTIRPDSYVQAAFIGSNDDDTWVMRAWRSLRFSPDK